MSIGNNRFGRAGRILGLLALCLAPLLIMASCGSSGDASESAPPNVRLSVSSGTFTTTVRINGTTKLPFSETIIVEAEFEDPIYGSAGQTSVFAEASPSAYRISPRTPRNDRTFTFALTNRAPGTVEISIFANRDSKPIQFTLQVGEE